MRRAHLLRNAVVTAAAVALIGAALYLVRGDRYRLYTSAQAARCWDSVRALAPPTASLRLGGIDELHAGSEPGTEVVVGYRMDRVFAGLELEARCRFPHDSLSASAILLNGEPIEPALLEEVNASLAGAR